MALMRPPKYIVNANHIRCILFKCVVNGLMWIFIRDLIVDCSDVNWLNSYDLVLGGQTDTFNTHVDGSAYFAGSGATEEICN